MRKKILFFMLLTIYVYNACVNILVVKSYRDWNYVYSYARITNNEQIACRMADVIVDNCIRKNIDVGIETRKIWKETRFKQHAISYTKIIKTNISLIQIKSNYIVKTNIYTNRQALAFGLSQVQLYCWDHLLYYTYDKKYAKRLLQNPNLKYKIIFYIGVNIDLGTTILSNYLDTYKTYDKALTAYWSGPNSTNFHNLLQGKSNHYINDILNGKLYDSKMKKYNNWKYIEKKKPEYKMIFVN